ncbi:MAG: PspC domain-containing protein, partial [Chloroflexi bacterium]|nr:PspC domain-containing protein [Chloroflexota bacterium]
MADYPPTPPSPPPAAPPPPYYPPYSPPPAQRRLVRSSRERMWAGVAGGIAEYVDLDPSLVRLLWVLATVVTGGLAVPV